MGDGVTIVLESIRTGQDKTTEAIQGVMPGKKINK